MTDLYVEGPDALKLFSDLGVNSFKNFRVDKAKQFVACNHDGYVIGDAILFHLGDEQVQARRPPAGTELGAVPRRDRRATTPSVERDERSRVNEGTPQVLPLSSAGPERRRRSSRRRPASPRPTSSSSTWTTITIAGKKVRALRHGMVGQPGWELFGPWADGDEVRDGIIEAGRELGIRKVGARTYPTSTLESGWIPSPLPAVYTGEQDEAVPPVARRQQLRGDGVARRQLLLERTSRTTT